MVTYTASLGDTRIELCWAVGYASTLILAYLQSLVKRQYCTTARHIARGAGPLATGMRAPPLISTITSPLEWSLPSRVKDHTHGTPLWLSGNLSQTDHATAMSVLYGRSATPCEATPLTRGVCQNSPSNVQPNKCSAMKASSCGPLRGKVGVTSIRSVYTISILRSQFIISPALPIVTAHDVTEWLVRKGTASHRPATTPT